MTRRSLALRRTPARLMGIVGILSLATVLGLPSTAQASAYGYSYWGAYVFKDVPIPKGQLFHATEGSKRFVKLDGGSFLSAGQLCNWWMDVDYLDTKGRTYAHIQGAETSTCARTGATKYAVNANVQTGWSCLTLYRRVAAPPPNITRVARQCHRIKAS